MEAKPCNTCGDIGVIEAIITCCECKIAREHLYCMRTWRTEAPLFWFCEECSQDKLVSPKTSINEPVPEASTQEVFSPMHHSTRVPAGPGEKTFASRFNFKEKIVHTGRTKYISCEEAAKLSAGAMKSRIAFRSRPGSLKSMPPPPPRDRTPIKTSPQERTTKFEPHLQQPIVQQSPGHKGKNVALPLQKRGDSLPSIKPPGASKRVERGNKAKNEVLLPRKEPNIEGYTEVPKYSRALKTTNTETGSKDHADADAGSSVAKKPNLIRGVLVSETHYTYIPALHAYWKGSFYLPYGHEKFNDTFNAHPPSRVHSKVYATLKKMPKNISFELVPNHEVWMDMFPDYCPDKDDIGLYFFPKFKKRSENCMSIMDFLWSKNLLMKSYVDGVELFVLSSRLLQPRSQEFRGNYFLWGVFRSTRHRNITKEGSSSTSSDVHDSNVNMGKKGSTVQPLLEVKHEPYDDAPPGFEKISKP